MPTKLVGFDLREPTGHQGGKPRAIAALRALYRELRGCGGCAAEGGVIAVQLERSDSCCCRFGMACVQCEASIEISTVSYLCCLPSSPTCAPRATAYETVSVV